MKFVYLALFFTFISNGFAFEEAFDETKVLTPEEEAQAKEYVNRGLVDREYNELCDEGRGGFDDICENDSSAFEEGSKSQKWDNALPAVLKAYTMIMSLTAVMKGGGEGDSKTDYCALAAGAAELAASTFIQSQSNKEKENFDKSSTQTKQADAFYAVANSQKNLAKASKTQGYLWGAVAACYGVMLATKSLSGDWKTYAKLAAATVVAGFYIRKAKISEKRAKILKQMAKELPQKGDCNPFTATTCFCAEETSAASDPTNFQRFCIPEVLAARAKNGSEPFICADAKGQPDPTCACAKTDTCIDKAFKVGAAKFGANPLLLKNPLQTLQPLSEGLSSANFEALDSQNRAFAKKQLENFKPKNVPKIKLNDEQKKIAQGLIKQGFPKLAAASIASQSTPEKTPALLSGSLGDSALAQSPEIKKAINADPRKTRSGGTIRQKSQRGKSNLLSRFKKKSGKKKDSIEILDFAEKATREAEIVKDTSKGIFDIISYRYRASGWKNLEVQN